MGTPLMLTLDDQQGARMMDCIFLPLDHAMAGVAWKTVVDFALGAVFRCLYPNCSPMSDLHVIHHIKHLVVDAIDASCLFPVSITDITSRDIIEVLRSQVVHSGPYQMSYTLSFTHNSATVYQQSCPSSEERTHT